MRPTTWSGSTVGGRRASRADPVDTPARSSPTTSTHRLWLATMTMTKSTSAATAAPAATSRVVPRRDTTNQAATTSDPSVTNAASRTSHRVMKTATRNTAAAPSAR